ncbi:MAG: DNA-binding response regulator, partial [Clostridia bacterium]
MLTCIEEFEAIKRAVNIGITGYIAKSTLDQNEIEQALSRVILELQEMPAKISEAQEDDLLRQQAFVDRYVFHRGNDHGDAFPIPQHNLQPILMTFDQQPNRKEQDRSSQYRTLRSVVLESGAGDLFTLACGYLIVLSTASASAVAYVTSQLDFVGRMVYNAQSRFVIGKRRDGIDSLYEQYPLLKRAREEHAGSSMCFLKETCDDYVQRAVGYINQHYAEDLSVAELAGRVGVTPNYLSSIFRKDVGGSVVEYLTRIRMENAQRLLAQTEMPVRQIAHRTGFS